MSDKLAWLQLRELVDDSARGRALFTGTRAQQNALLIEFRNYVRQAQTYWNAAELTTGSASALPYYYSMLNLAKAELLQTNPTEIVRKQIHHGLSANFTEPTSIRGDGVKTPCGVFPLLYEKRTGSILPPKLRFPITNILSLIPEVGHEMSHFGSSRPFSPHGFHAFAMNGTEAWSAVLLAFDVDANKTEPVIKRLLTSYRRVELDGDWRRLFALSARFALGPVSMFESKETFSKGSPPEPDREAAMYFFADTMGDYLSPPLYNQADFQLTHSVWKSQSLVIPLSLVRYIAMFYLSSLVRYKPTSLDPSREGNQAWLLDSFATEVPSKLLAGAVEGITKQPAYFEPGGYRI